LLLQRLVALADEQRNPLGCIGCGRLAAPGDRISAFQGFAALRFYCFAACFVAPSHRPPEAQDGASYRFRRAL
jgi:hypothetical protein